MLAYRKSAVITILIVALFAGTSASDTGFFSHGYSCDIAVISAGAGLWALGKYQINHAPRPDPLAEKTDDIPAIDRFATKYYSETVSDYSDMSIEITGVLSLVTLLTAYSGPQGGIEKLARGFVIYAETMLLVDGLTDVAKGTFNRSRPLVYNDSVPMGKRSTRFAAQSFWSKHAATAFANAVFAGYTFQRLHPDSRWTRYVWCAGLTSAAATAVLRVRAGMHFPTDVAAGAAVGSCIGWAIPKVHEKYGGSVLLSPEVNGAAGLNCVYLF